MTTLEIILELVRIIALLIPMITSVVILIKKTIKEKDWKMVMKIAQEVMTTVEEYSLAHPGMSGEEKLNMALEAINSGLTAAGIDPNPDLIQQVVAYIQEMCAWAKTVNVKK